MIILVKHAPGTHNATGNHYDPTHRNNDDCHNQAIIAIFQRAVVCYRF
jgi:hypothetical protein